MTKKEKIQEAYGCDVDGLVDVDGWSIYGVDEGSEYGVEPYGDYETKNHYDGKYEWRPNSLSGIEDNNSWVKIESDADFPNDNKKYWIMFQGEIHQKLIPENRSKWWINEVSHYQPIQKPQPPIY